MMPLDKRCAQEGCDGLPIFGFGLPSKGIMRWACRLHRDLIWIAAAPRAASEGGQIVPPGASRPPSDVPRQGRLI